MIPTNNKLAPLIAHLLPDGVKFACLVNRLSNADGMGAQRQADAGMLKYRQLHPVLAELVEQPDGLFTDTPVARAQREAAGMVEIRARHISPLAVDPNELVGYARSLWPSAAGQCPLLVFDILSSAIEDNIQDPADVDGAGKNIFTELTRLVLVTYEALILDIMFSRWDRASRSRHWSLLEHSLRSRAHRTTTWIDGAAVKWSNAGDLIMNSVNAGMGEGSGLAFKKMTFGGTCSALQADRWPRGLHVAPAGLKQVGRGKPASRTIAWDEYRAGAVGLVLLRFGQGRSLPAIADEAAASKLPLSRRGVPFHERTREQQVECLRRLLSDQASLTLYRTGVYTERVVSPISGAREVEGWPLEFADRPDEVIHRAPGSPARDLYYHGYSDFTLQWGLPGRLLLDDGCPPRVEQLKRDAADSPTPDGAASTEPELGFGWSAELWDEIDRRSRELREGKKPRPRRTATGRGRLFVGHRWVDEEHEWRLTGTQSRAVVVERRASDGSGPWDHVLTCLDRDLLMAYAEAQRAWLVSVADLTIPLTRIEQPERDEERTALAASLATLGEQADAHRRAAQSLRAAMGQAHTWELPPEDTQAQVRALALQAVEADREADQHLARASRVAEQLEQLDRRQQEATADVTVHATLTAALLHAARKGEVQHEVPVMEAVAAVTRRLTITPHPRDEKRAVLSVDFTVPLADGTLATGSARRELENLRRITASHDVRAAEAALDRSLVRRRLAEGEELGALLSAPHQRGGAPDGTLQRMRSHLRRTGIASRGLRSAALDCPVAETRAALWALIDSDAETAQHLEPAFVQRVHDIYTSALSHPNVWVGREVDETRRVLNALLTLRSPAQGCAVGDLARASGVPQTQVLALVRQGVLVRSPQNHQVVAPRTCPHCGGFAAHYLPVPETLAGGLPGLLCASCLRLPDPAENAVFPTDYAAAWTNTAPPHSARLAADEGTSLASSRTSRPRSSLARHERLLNVAEAAEVLGVSPTAVRGWSKEGLLHRKRREGVGKHLFDEDELHTDAVQQLAARWRETYGRRWEVKGLLTLRQISQQLRVPEHKLRRLVRDGGLEVAVDRGPGAGGGLYFDPDDVAAIPPAWRDAHRTDLLSLADVRRITGRSAGEIRRAADKGTLPSVRVGRSWRRFEADAVSVWRRSEGMPDDSP